MMEKKRMSAEMASCLPLLHTTALACFFGENVSQIHLPGNSRLATRVFRLITFGGE